jgi:hypothetical protein
MLLTTSHWIHNHCYQPHNLPDTGPTAGVVVLELSACYLLRQLSSDRNWIVTKLAYSFYDDIFFFFFQLPFLFIITGTFVVLHYNVCPP